MDKITLPFLDPKLSDKILKESKLEEVSKGTILLREHQYVKVIPIVIDGLVKVYSKYNDKELLLYYLESAHSCVMTFYAALKNTPSRVYAMTEEDSKILLIPVQHLSGLLKDHPDLNNLFFDQFNLRYMELLDTVGHLLVDKMDKRVYDHLSKKSKLTGCIELTISHVQVANELGTAREVVSRVMKKLENEGKIEQKAGKIRINA
ncbi:Crp/Fnr family transcriptional regulator [Reichenbachiella versicolor]|uniref:Crp/Fnr family transcriptional regulator n=1 Tax=Reichenbachiella versicolor TaxID=1821036 RepID=UPI001FE959C7|nr:Crp/Fnr family transcriptional regulator [Reichenbachiella versicolor]